MFWMPQRVHLSRYGLASLCGVLFAGGLGLAQQPKFKLPEGVEKRSVTIWSDGTRMAGDLYLPKDRTAGEKLPAVIFCSGTGGTKDGTPLKLVPYFVKAGYAFLAFDYRGWGKSDARLMTTEKQPKPDEKGEMTVKTKALRWQMDLADQTHDIRCAIAFLAGDPDIDKNRIGLLGTSYGGGLVVWVAGNEPRVKCVVAQVPGMGGGRTPIADQRAFDLLSKQSRAEVEPVPIETGKLGGQLARYDMMRANPAKGIGYKPVEAAEKIKAPTLIVVAEKEELLDNKMNGGKVAETLKKNGVPVDYHVIKGIGHYGVYSGEGFAEAVQLEIEWFNKYLKDASTAPKPAK